LAKINVEQILDRAKLLSKKGRYRESYALYKQVLNSFPQNIRAKKAVEQLINIKINDSNNNPPSEVINKLLHLFNNKKFSSVIEKVQALTYQYPRASILWNILGVSAYQTHMPDKAIKAYKKALSINPDYAEAYNNMGVALKDLGKIDKAIQIFNKAILIKPDYVEAYNNLGNAYKDQYKPEDAIKAYKKAISLKPDYAEAYNNLGNSLNDLGRFKEAIEFINKSISLKPNYVLAFNNLGVVLATQGKLDEAINAFKKALLINPDYADAYNNIGNALKHQGKIQDAIGAFKNAILINSDFSQAYNSIGKLLLDQGKFQDAIDQFKNAILTKSDYVEAYNNKGVALRHQSKFQESINAFKKALSLKPEYAEAYNNLGNVLNDQGKLDKAINAFKKAILLKPDYSEAYGNMGVVIKNQGKLDYAIDTFKKSISINPRDATAHKQLSFTLLNHGRLKEGFDEYEWRWKTSDFLSQKRHFLKPLWDGKHNLKGKTILLWCEQGVGDTIMWSSCLQFIISQAKHCILECQKKLVPILKRSFPNIDVKAEDRSLDQQRDDFDFHLPMGSLYKNFIRDITKNYKSDAYLIPDLVRVDYWRNKLMSLGKGPFIGISWKSSNLSPDRIQNYAEIFELTPILNISDVIFINLQYVNFEEDLKKIRHKLGIEIHNFDELDHFNNLDDVAALCSALDMVVSTKTTVPLISAAVGTSTKLANWKQSGWNNILLNPRGPSVDIYERDTCDPWDNVFSPIAEDILKLYENGVVHE
jgi:tetratricopeptide (TPR) repeat protein